MPVQTRGKAGYRLRRGCKRACLAKVQGGGNNTCVGHLTENGKGSALRREKRGSYTRELLHVRREGRGWKARGGVPCYRRGSVRLDKETYYGVNGLRFWA